MGCDARAPGPADALSRLSRDQNGELVRGRKLRLIFHAKVQRPLRLCVKFFQSKMYVELHARSAFSFLEGASVPEELIAAGLALELPAMALLDRDGVYGAPRFHLSAKKNGIKAHMGAEITVKTPTAKNKTCSIPVLVKTRQGY